MQTALIIDDIDFTRETIGEMLKRGGYKVLEASNGRQGLQVLEEHRPDIVLTDILMPEMEGLETIRKLTNLTPKPPIIAITGCIDKPFLEIALSMGADFGLYKPFKQAELLSAVSLSLKKAEQHSKQLN